MHAVGEVPSTKKKKNPRPPFDLRSDPYDPPPICSNTMTFVFLISLCSSSSLPLFYTTRV